jgi:sigma-B regulation protein RsbU (phosphoserine phosphatase)
VGGDYYDFIPANYDQRQIQTETEENNAASTVPWSIVIGDVMGKGVPAGLIMTMTRGMLRAEVLNHHSPSKILEHLNRVMYDDLESSHRFVTLFYSQYDPKTRRLSYSNAAHNPPLWWQASTNTVHRLDTVGMLVGLDTNSEYEDDSVQLAPGDTVLYYTDGFTDAVNAKGQRFEEENLIDSFQWAAQQQYSPEAIVQHLFERVQAFMGSQKRSVDDMTLVVMQVKDEAV